MTILADCLSVALGLAGSGVLGLPSLVLVVGCLSVLDAIGLRLKVTVQRRRMAAVALVTVMVAAHVVWMWFLAGWIIGWLGVTHGLVVRVGATVGALGMGCMCWIFICCALDRMITDPRPPSDGAAPDGGGG
jgi:hypothetical protein